jgi:hypothetical protein
MTPAAESAGAPRVVDVIFAWTSQAGPCPAVPVAPEHLPLLAEAVDAARRHGAAEEKERLAVLGAVHEQGAAGALAPVPPGRAPDDIIWHVGERQYRVGKWSGLVSDAEDDVLQTFVDQPAQDRATLMARSGREDPGRVLRDLRKKYGGVFAAAVHPPGKKGRGGYCVRVEPVPS